jgi:hypothetical protein
MVPTLCPLACADEQRMVRRSETYLADFFAVFFAGLTAALALALAGIYSTKPGTVGRDRPARRVLMRCRWPW